ncbi:MAG: hypothetical protein V1910_01370 [bacterium]
MKKTEEEKIETEYKKPVLQEMENMIFPEEILQEFNKGHWCFGCSNCNCN